MSAGRIVLLIFGIIFIVGAVLLMLAGGGVLWANAAMTDGEGFLHSGTTRLESDTHAMVTQPAEIEWDAGCWGPWCYDSGDFVTFKIEGENEDPSKGIFIGVAAEDEVRGYLDDVTYDEIVEWSPGAHTEDIDYRRHPGDSVPVDPTTQDFWEASAYGTGAQNLIWEPEEGDWVLVIMNQDASEGVAVSGTVGAKVPWLFQIGVGLLVAGAIILVLGIVMMLFAVRQPRPSAS